MEYKKDTRTKNLTLRDIHVGDWVQVWSEQAERYSPPLKIIQICDDGTIYLVTSDEERCTPWEEDIKNVDALPIDTDLLRGFGFIKDGFEFKYVYGDLTIIVDDRLPHFFCFYSSLIKKTDYYSMAFFNDMQNRLYRLTGINPKFEWKGLRND